MKTSQTSLESHMKKLAMSWALAGLFLTLGLSLSVFYWLPFKDAENQIKQFSSAAISSRRTDLLSGEVRTIELQIRSELNLKKDEQAVFLDPKMDRWLKDSRPLALKACLKKDAVCRDYLHKKVIYYAPIYFDNQSKYLWGYLYVEKNPATNWTMVFSVVLAIFAGMLFQGIGFYLGLTRSIRVVGKTLKDWTQKISLNPKNRTNYAQAPFSEISSIESALTRLRGEIDDLYSIARTEGALETLRAVGHDILNPVARMKRIIGSIQLENNNHQTYDPELINGLSANTRRLSNYAEQLKFLYKQELGEAEQKLTAVNVSDEIKSLVKELRFHPDAQDKQVSIQADIEDRNFISIPIGALGRMVENICSNSIQASKQSGSVSVSVKSQSGRVFITVEDKGHGIPDSIKAKIFNPGFTSRPNQGTGLGLFVVRQICDQYGGKLHLESAEGQGTTIIIEFQKIEVEHELQNTAG